MVSSQLKQRVYLLCRPIFTDQHSRMRQSKAVTNMVSKNSDTLQPLLDDMGEDRLVAILCELLKNGVFESKNSAKAEFPSLFPTSPMGDAQHQTSELVGADSSAETLNEGASSDESERCGAALTDGRLPSSEQEDGPLAPEKAAEEHHPTQQIRPNGLVTEKSATQKKPKTERKPGDAKGKLPSLYPSYLPYEAQHAILTIAQRVLEECFFDFAAEHKPSILRSKGWKCPAAGELSNWTHIMAKKKIFMGEKSNVEGVHSAREHLLRSASTLRNTAVHREPATVEDMCGLLEAAHQLAKALGNDVRSAFLEELLVDVRIKVAAMELKTATLEDQAAHELEQIRQQREELDKMEKRAIRRMLQEDDDNKATTGRLLEASVRSIFSRESREGSMEEVNEKDSNDQHDKCRVEDGEGTKNVEAGQKREERRASEEAGLGKLLGLWKTLPSRVAMLGN